MKDVFPLDPFPVNPAPPPFPDAAPPPVPHAEEYPGAPDFFTVAAKPLRFLEEAPPPPHAMTSGEFADVVTNVPPPPPAQYDALVVPDHACPTRMRIFCPQVSVKSPVMDAQFPPMPRYPAPHLAFPPLAPTAVMR